MTKGEREDQESAQRSADRLAIALEDAGFDVGQEFPALHDAIGRQGAAVVRIGDVRPAVADRLATALVSGATRQTEEGDNRQ
ncbi:hypothetical protein [Paractinoplanes brasiliensis]|uniref:Uncharacterized protein n=1 Tax=Paractinoplanes brasiliensis TaxID=52695 RepID=A0A4V3C7C5_9ACTN|nr:hypothetical protein [Actinoplanes brasiliensis]TDO37168.1 hypothetical protein C8E87_0774 [Actinoplanes brasiliensis]GID32915.1 hypothetical protein Abr02nite_78980 [Actinoplanes brasiliensis]